MKKFALGFVGLIILAVVILGLGGCGTYNRLVSLSQNTDRAWAQVQNVYQRRADLIPNLVQTVSGAANFEKSTLQEVVNARASATQVKLDPGKAPLTAEQLQQFEKAQGALSSALSRLLVVVEKYPELRATQNFRDLQVELAGTENRIAVERMRFNEAVQSYNTAVKKFPAVVFAGMFGFQTRPYFTASPGTETPPKVQFDFSNKTTSAPPAR